ncbi:PIF1-like helicase [Medicago truncatula]|uniref:PIF1-like helicase n=1 Tax=Medicago truncatula TaxID=3880 RepID=A0A072V4M8_MEDTR|nr:PIF1-like helicase [Medicago truncatula]
MSTKNSIATIVEITYPSILDSMTDIAYFQDKAILTTKNSIVKQINDYMFGFDSRQINCEGPGAQVDGLVERMVIKID